MSIAPRLEVGGHMTPNYPDITCWRQKFSGIDACLRNAVDSLLDIPAFPVTKHGRRSAPAVYAAILATTDFLSYECRVGRKELARLAGVDAVTVTGAYKILRSLGLIEMGPTAQRFVVRGLNCVTSQADAHPFELTLRDVFRDGRAAGVRGTPLFLFFVIAHLGKYSREVFSAKLPELRALSKLSDHTIISGLDKLQKAGLLRRWAGKGNSTQLQLVLPTMGSVDQYELIDWISAKLDSNQETWMASKRQGSVWSCLAAVLSLQTNSQTARGATYQEIQQVLYGQGTLAHSIVDECARFGLIERTKTGILEASFNTIHVIPPSNLPNETASDSLLILGILLSWRRGDIARMGATVLRAQLRLLREANFSQVPIFGSLRTLDSHWGVRREDVLKLQELGLLRAVGEREKAHHVLLVPAPNQADPLQISLFDQLKAAGPQATDSDDRAFCRTVASIIETRATQIKVWKDSDLSTFFHVAVLTKFSFESFSPISVNHLKVLGSANARYSLDRLVRNGAIDRAPSNGKCPAQYRLRSSTNFSRPIAVQGSAQFVSVVRNLVAPRFFAQGKPRELVVTSMYLQDLWIYAAIATDMGFVFETPRRYTRAHLQRISGVDRRSNERLARLEESGFLKIEREGRARLNISLLSGEHVGTAYIPQAPKRPAWMKQRRTMMSAGKILKKQLRTKHQLREPIAIATLAKIVRKAGRSDKLAAKMRRVGLKVVQLVEGGKYFVEKDVAIARYPKFEEAIRTSPLSPYD